MKPIVYIHTNDNQIVGALVSQYSLKKRSRHADKFDVKVLRLEETPHLYDREGDTYLRKGREAVWHNDDLQSFSPLRKLVPQAMGFQGRALVIDPDVFAVGDVYELLDRDMGGKAIVCKHETKGYRGNGVKFFASSVMLLDCQKLKHWTWDDQIDQMFDKTIDYGPWISLLDEDENTIGELEQYWNHFDQLDEDTKLLHNTERSTQPWKTGLPVDYDTTWRKKKSGTQADAASGGLMDRILCRFKNKSQGEPPMDRYLPHPDPNQIVFFMSLLREALDAGAISEDLIESEIDKKHLRPDIMQVMNNMCSRA